MSSIVASGGLTAVAKNDLPYACASPVRTSPTASTPGTSAMLSPTEAGIGEKLFCAVTA